MTLHTRKYQLEERRRQIASMLAQSMTEVEIANKLGIDQSTVSRDIKALKHLSQKFIYDLANSDLVYYYKQCLNGIEEAKRKAWTIFNRLDESPNPRTTKDSLLALKITIECNQAQFTLFKEGPTIMQINHMEQRLGQIESRQSIKGISQEVQG